MKRIFLTFLLLSVTIGYSQKINEKLKNCIETDNVKELSIELENLKYSIDDCFELKEKPYSLFALAIKLEKENLFNFLIEKKADLNKICEDKSPLMYATKYGNLKFVKKLVELGAEINLKNSDGKTAIDYAKKYEQTEIANYLESIKK